MRQVQGRRVSQAGDGGLLNEDRLRMLMAEAGIDVIVAAAPENTYYLSGVFIRTQVSIRDRLALVLWPLEGEPSFVVCNIEESLARSQGNIQDVKTYIEFKESPIHALASVARDRGYATRRIGLETRYLSAHYHAELIAQLPDATLVSADGVLERARAVKTPLEISRIADAFRRTETAIRGAWSRSRAGDTEKAVSHRMLLALLENGADGLRHITLTSGANTVHVHMTPAGKPLRPGDTVLTDFGGHFQGFSSDMARMGIVGEPAPEIRREYQTYRAVYVELLGLIRPGMTGADVYGICRRLYEESGLPMTFPHVGHSLTRMGGHENPMLRPGCDQVIEPNMLLAVEPSFRPKPDRRYHLEDLVRVTDDGAEVMTDWRSTSEMIPIQG